MRCVVTPGDVRAYVKALPTANNAHLKIVEANLKRLAENREDVLKNFELRHTDLGNPLLAVK